MEKTGFKLGVKDREREGGLWMLSEEMQEMKYRNDGSRKRMHVVRNQPRSVIVRSCDCSVANHSSHNCCG